MSATRPQPASGTDGDMSLRKPINEIQRRVPALAFRGIAAAGWLLVIGGCGDYDPAPPVSPNRVAVLPFSVRGSAELAYLGDGLVDLLSTKLDGTGELRSVDPRAVLGFVAQEDGGSVDPERGREIASRLGAGLFVLGDVLVDERQLRLSASLYKYGRKIKLIAEASSDGEAAELFGLIDDVAAQLLAAQLDGPGTRAARIAAMTTSSLDALEFYLQGERALRSGRFVDAGDAFLRAIEVDSVFALAWYRLSVAAERLTRLDVVRTATERASRYSARLSRHDRRLLEARVASRRGDAAEAERLYRAILGTYPDDVEAWLELGELLFHYGPLEGDSVQAARDAFDRVLSYEPDHPGALTHLVRIAALEASASELDSLATRFLEANPKSDRAVEIRALRAFVLGDEAGQAAVIADLERADDVPLLITAWSVPIYGRNLEGGARLYVILAEPSRSAELRAFAHIALAHLALARGRLDQAVQELAAAERIDPARAVEHRALMLAAPFLATTDDELLAARADIERLDPDAVARSMNPSGFISVHDGLHDVLRSYLLGSLGARLGEDYVALRLAARLERADGSAETMSLALDLALSLRAQVAWSDGRQADALRLLQLARMQRWYQRASQSPFFSQAYERFLRGTLLEKTGRVEEALEWYDSFGAVSIYDLVYLAPSHLRRAEIYERLGDRERAIEHYTRFVQLWADADPGLLPMVRRAEERLAALTAESAG